MTKRALSKVVMLKTSLCSSYKQFILFYFILFLFFTEHTLKKYMLVTQ